MPATRPRVFSRPAAILRPALGAAAAACALAAGCGPSGSAPAFSPIDRQVVAVNQQLVLTLSASDPDGDALTYHFDSDVPGIDGRATITVTPEGAGEFRWTPLAADIGSWRFDFTASDGSHEVTRSARIDVRSAVGANTAPRFVHPQGLGTTLNLDRDGCLEQAVEVVDDDSPEVSLALGQPAVEGATLSQTGPLSGTWRWCPSGAQIAADDRYTVMFTADDHDNPASVHPYLVVLRRPAKPGCPGAPPVIEHTPADETTLVGLTLAADISDDEGLKREPLLYYSTAPPSDPPDLASMSQVPMLLIDGTMQAGTWAADVPNPVADQPAGQSRSLYYVIVATDDDDPAGACDHSTVAPAGGSYHMTVTSPGGTGGAGLCQVCTHDVQCGGAGDLCVPIGTDGASYCLRGCSGAGDCPSGTSCSSAAIGSVDGASARQCVPDSESCTASSADCDDDGAEDNDNRSQAQVKPLLAAGDHALVSCPAALGTGDDEDWFRIGVAGDTRVTLQLGGGSQSDLDLALYDGDGALVDSSVSFSSTEEVSACLPPGTYYARVLAWSPVENPYHLSLSRAPETCAATCEVDDGEDDDGPLQARATDLAAGPYTSTTQSICTGDDDWYRVELGNDQLLSVDLTFEQTDSHGDLDIHLYDQDAVDLTPCSTDAPEQCALDNGQSADSDEHFEAVAPAAGCPCTYYVVVHGFGGSENLYDISIEARDP